MSVVCCKITPDWYEMSADSQTTRGMTKEMNIGVKLFECNYGAFHTVIGGVGYAEDMTLMKLFTRLNNIKGINEDDVMEYMSSFYDWRLKKTGKAFNEEIHSHFLIGVADNIYTVEGWYIKQVEQYHAIGAGSDYALTALHLGEGTERAVEIACELNIYCNKPIKTIRKVR